MYFSLYRPDNSLDHEVLAEVLNISTTPTSPTNISNQYSGTVSLRGKLLTATILLNGASKEYYDLPWETRLDETLTSRTTSDSHKDSKSFYRHYFRALNQLATLRGDLCQPDVKDTQSNDSITSLKQADRYELDYLVRSLTTKRDGYLPPYIPSESEFQTELLDRGFCKEGLRQGGFPGTRYNLPDDYSGHPIFSDRDRAQVGYWAPDYKNSDCEYSVVFLAVSRSRGLVYCLGLELVDAKRHLYRRVGLGFWHERAWGGDEFWIISC